MKLKWIIVCVIVSASVILLAGIYGRRMWRKQTLRAQTRQREALRNEFPQRHASDRIFVYLTSFRDPMLSDTLANLFSRAVYPFRVHVGICAYQSAIDPDVQEEVRKKLCGLQLPEAVDDNVRVLSLPWEEERGPVYARYLIHRYLFQQQPFSLVLSSHARMAPGWDEFLIREWAAVHDNRKLCLTGPLDTIGPEHTWAWHAGRIARTLPPSFHSVVPDSFDDVTGLPRIQAAAMHHASPEATPALLWSPEFAFSASLLYHEVPFADDWSDCWKGEEILYSARAYAKGWAFVHPPFQFACSNASNGMIKTVGKPSVTLLPNLPYPQILRAEDVHALHQQTGIHLERQTVTWTAARGLSIHPTRAEIGTKYGSVSRAQQHQI